MTYFQSVRAGKVDPVILDGGDFLFTLGDYKKKGAQKEQMIEKAKLIVEAYNELGYQAAAIGECELVYGLGVLDDLRKKMKFPLLCANLVSESTGKPLFDPSAIIEHGGLKIGVVSVIMELSPNYVKKNAPGAKLVKPIPALREELNKIKDQVDLVFVLGHLNRPDVEKIAKEMDEVDFILEPNSHVGNHNDWVARGERFLESTGNLMLKIDAEGAHVARLDVEFHGRGLPWVLKEADAQEAANRYSGYDVELGPNFGKNQVIERAVQAFKAGTRQKGASLSSKDFTPSQDYLTVNTCKACHPDQYGFWQKTEHADAYATLEKTGDQHRYDCIPCHVLAYGETFIDSGDVGTNKDVQCESCHGSNPEHPTDPKNKPWKNVTHKDCWGCHNPRVTQAEFRPSEAIPKIKCPPMTRR